jgi:hypothetical protein
MRRLLSLLKAFVDHPTTRLLVGLALVLTGLTEICRDIIDESRQFRVGIHHGVFILGLAQTLSALPDVVLGIEKWLLAAETVKVEDCKVEPLSGRSERSGTEIGRRNPSNIA